MLSYAFQVLRQRDFTDMETEAFDNIHNLFAVILSKGINRQLKQGLYREYQDREDNLNKLRGKINISGSLKLQVERKNMLRCEFDEFTENNKMNQILKSTALLLIHKGTVKTEYKHNLKQDILYFSNVDVVDLRRIAWSRIRFHRHNQNYHMLISICKLIVEGMLLTEASGEHKLANYIDDQAMFMLYENFLYGYFSKEHAGIEVKSSRFDWFVDEESTLLPKMKTDITLIQNSKVLIIDAKYYEKSGMFQNHHNKKSIRSDHLYQIFAYVKNYHSKLFMERTALVDLPEVSGLLLYAQTSKEGPVNQSYLMSGNRISVRTLDLNSEFEIIRDELDAIVVEHFGNLA